MKTKEIRQEEAEARQRARDGRSPATQLAHLDAKLGVGVGAKKERARLNALIEKEERS